MWFLCEEDHGEFVLESSSLETAQRDAALYCGIVVRELKKDELTWDKERHTYFYEGE